MKLLLRYLALVIASCAVSASAALINNWPLDTNVVDSVTGNAGVFINNEPGTGGTGFFHTFQGHYMRLTRWAWDDMGPEACNFGTNDFSVSFWARSWKSEELLNKAPCDPAAPMWSFKGNSLEQVEFAVGDSATTATKAVGGQVSDGYAWFSPFDHIVGTRHGTTNCLYLNGTCVSTMIAPSVANITNNASVLAAHNECGVWADLCIHDITVYDTALSLGEVYEIYAPGTMAIVSQPHRQAVLAGESAAFQVAAAAPGPISYQWQFNGGDIAGATNSAFTIASVQASDVGSYSVMVSSDYGYLISSNAYLRIHPPLDGPPGLISRWSGEGYADDAMLLYDAESATCQYGGGVLGRAFKFTSGQNVSFGNEVFNLGTNDFTISFWMKGPAVPPAPSQTVMSAGAGGMGVSMAANGLVTWGFGNGGLYAGVFNDNVFHHILALREGSEVRLYVDGTLKSKAPWGGVSLNGLKPFMLGNTFDGELDEVQLFSRALTDDEITGLAHPANVIAFLSQPEDKLVDLDDAVSLSVVPLGDGPFSYQWQHDGSDIAGATDSSFIIADAQVSDAGLYTVSVTDGAGHNGVSIPARLSVIDSADYVVGDLINKWTADGTAVDSVTAVAPTFFSAVYGTGILTQAFTFDGTGADRLPKSGVRPVKQIVNGTNGIVWVPYSEPGYTNGELIHFPTNVGNFGNGDFTVGFWIKTSALKQQAIINKLPTTSGYGNWHFRTMANGNILFEVFGPSYNGVAGGNVADGNFHQVTGVRSGDTIYLYIDGGFVAKNQVAGVVMDVSNDGPLRLGDDPFQGSDDTVALRGALDEIEFYGRALQSNEVYFLANPPALAPTIINPPLSAAASLGDKPSLRVSAKSAGKLQYQWFYNGEAIAGATKSTLPLGTITTGSAGDYSVMITGKYGSTVSQVATLDIQLSPGTYQGIFVDDAGTDAATGGFTLTLAHNQTFSGVALQHGVRIPLKGKLSKSGTTIQAGALNLNLNPLLSGRYDTIQGSVQGSSWNSSLLSHHVRTTAMGLAPQRGKHTLVAQKGSGSGPDGSGCGSLTVGNGGGVKLVGNLADNSSISQSVALDQDGNWPVYISLYGGNGSIAGWLNVSNGLSGSCSGLLRWNKTAAYGKYYAAAFAASVPVMGSTFAPPAEGLGIDLNNANVVLDGAGVSQNTTASVTGTTITFDGANGSAKFTPSTGCFSGKHYDPISKISTPIKGVVLQQQQQASGYFLTTTDSGLLLMQKQ